MATVPTGPAGLNLTTMAIPFEITITDEKISQLKAKLETVVLPDELDEAGWEYGVPLADIKRLVAYWKDGYNWKQEEKKLNEDLPQFTTDIEVEGHGSLNIHFVHKKSEEKDAIPLLFVHGCRCTTCYHRGRVWTNL